jgi:partner of Y14 and mago protein
VGVVCLSKSPIIYWTAFCSVRKQVKIRPGFTPQEDVRRFRGTKQAQMDANVLPKGHIVGWAPPQGATKPTTNDPSNPSTSSSTTPMTKAAKKNAKRKEKREKEKAEREVPDSWEDNDEQEQEKTTTDEKASTQESVEDALSSQLEKLDVQ